MSIHLNRPLSPSEARFDGEVKEPGQAKRLGALLERVRQLMSDGEWRSLAVIQRKVGGSEASISARLRDLRKPRFGGLLVLRRHVGRGLYEYRIAS